MRACSVVCITLQLISCRKSCHANRKLLQQLPQARFWPVVANTGHWLLNRLVQFGSVSFQIDFTVRVKSPFGCRLSRCQCVVQSVCLGSAEEFNLCCWLTLVFAWAKIRTFNAFLRAWREGEKQETERQKREKERGKIWRETSGNKLINREQVCRYKHTDKLTPNTLLWYCKEL